MRFSYFYTITSKYILEFNMFNLISWYGDLGYSKDVVSFLIDATIIMS